MRKPPPYMTSGLFSFSSGPNAGSEDPGDIPSPPPTFSRLPSISPATGTEGATFTIDPGAGLADSLVDGAAVACGAVVAAGAWRNRGAAVGAALALLAVIGIRGVGRRQ